MADDDIRATANWPEANLEFDPKIQALAREYARRVNEQGLRLLREVRSYRGESNRDWYTMDERALLDVLEGAGLIEQVLGTRPGDRKPRRNYRLTPKGDEFLDTHGPALPARREEGVT